MANTRIWQVFQYPTQTIEGLPEGLALTPTKRGVSVQPLNASCDRHHRYKSTKNCKLAGREWRPPRPISCRLELLDDDRLGKAVARPLLECGQRLHRLHVAPHGRRHLDGV